MNNSKKEETKRIIIFLAITFMITYGYCFGIVYPLVNTANVSGVTNVLVTLLISVVMFFPSIGVLLTRLITKEGFQDVWLRPHFKGNIKTYLLAYFGPAILTILGMVVYFAVFPGKLDMEFGYMKSVLEASGATPESYPMPLSFVILSQTFTAFFLGPVLNFVTCFGEEWGWRGYLLPKMSKKFSLVKMLLINGVIWGLWHAPLTALGHNYGVGYPGFPFLGILAMCGFCIMLGILFSYVSMRTQSCIPAVLAHGAVNSICGLGLYFTTDGGNPFIGPTPTGILGAIPFWIVAIWLLVRRDKWKVANSTKADNENVAGR